MGTWEVKAVVEYVQRNHLFLHYDQERDIDLWTPHVKVPIGLRRGIVRHKQQLLRAMHEARIETCPSPYLHRRYWVDGTCELCLKLG